MLQLLDDDDELQDWTSVLGAKALLKRGEKEFAPDGTEIQSETLLTARRAMYGALEVPRGFFAKNKLEAIWMPDCHEALVVSVKGSHFKDAGRQASFGRHQVMWLTPVETTYLVERGSMAIYLDDGIARRFLAGHVDTIAHQNLREMSLQHLYSVALSNPGDMDTYLVYAYLKRQGYLLQTYSLLVASQAEQLLAVFLPSAFSHIMGPCATYLKSFRGMIYRTNPLAFQKQHVFSYLLVYKALNFIPAYSTYDSLSKTASSNYSIAFNVWKPQPNFSKKNPPLPDFHVCVVNTKRQSFPSLEDIQSLHNSLNHVVSESITFPSPVTKQTSNKSHSAKKLQRAQKAQDKLVAMSLESQNRIKYQKTRLSMLRNGPSGRSVVLATVDDGIINFIALNEGDFSLKGHAAKKLRPLAKLDVHGIIYTVN